MQGTEMHLLLPPGDTATLVRGQAGPGRAHCSCPASTAQTVVPSCSQAALNVTGTELCAPLTYLLRVSLDAEHRAPTRRDRRATRQLCSLRDGTGGASRTPPASCRGLPCAPPRQ